MNKITLTSIIIVIMMLFSCKPSEQVSGTYSGTLSTYINPDGIGTITVQKDGDKVNMLISCQYFIQQANGIMVSPNGSNYDLNLYTWQVPNAMNGDFVEIHGTYTPYNSRLYIDYVLKGTPTNNSGHFAGHKQ